MSAKLKILNVDLGDKSYPIYIGRDLLSDNTCLEKHIFGQQVMVVTNSTVAPIYLDKVIKLSFQQRRKKLKNSLKRLDIQENILEDSIFGLRPEQLSVEEFVKLTQKISDETI